MDIDRDFACGVQDNVAVALLKRRIRETITSGSLVQYRDRIDELMTSMITGELDVLVEILVRLGAFRAARSMEKLVNSILAFPHQPEIQRPSSFAH